MRIAHLVSTFPPYRGGIGNVACQYARELALLGDEVEVFTPDYGGKGKGEEAENGFKVHRLSPWFRYGNAALVPQLLWKLTSFDIIHLHYPFFGGGEWILFLKWIFVKSPKVVFSYHMDVIGEGFLKLFFKGYGKTILPLLVRGSDALIVSSLDYGKTSLISRFLDQRPLYDIPYGVSSHYHPKGKNEKLMNRLNLSAENRLILFVGGLDRAHYFKGVLNLILAVKGLNRKEVKLILVGNGDLIPAYRKEARKENLQDQVLFITGVTDEELPDYYNMADLVVLPSVNRSEAFGIVLLEAMACGKPVIGSSLPGVRTLIEDHGNGFLVTPGDVSDLKEKIGFLLDHPELGEEYGLTGFKKVEEHFRWDQVIQQVKKVYLEVLEKPVQHQGVNR